MDWHGREQKPPRRHSDVPGQLVVSPALRRLLRQPGGKGVGGRGDDREIVLPRHLRYGGPEVGELVSGLVDRPADRRPDLDLAAHERSEEHTSELQSLMRISYAAFSLKKKTHKLTHKHNYTLRAPKIANKRIRK